MAVDEMAVDNMPEAERIEDGADDESLTFPATYDIMTFGADIPVDGLVKRLDEKNIIIPEFQRGYVWSHDRASRFIESLLIGLPTPTIFLWRDDEKRLVVIDGQQRLRSIQYFCSGSFKDTGTFALKGVRNDLEGLTYDTLGPEQKRALDDSLLHAFIVRQEAPTEDHSSIYHVFERLNTGMMPLYPHEIRTCLYQGGLVDLLEEMNGNEAWRAIFGARHSRMKDKELILRVTALYHSRNRYEEPMKQFLNEFLKRHRTFSAGISRDACHEPFVKSIRAIHGAVGDSAFKPRGRLNAAVLDGVMIGVATRQAQADIADAAGLKARYDALLADTNFLSTTDQATTNQDRVLSRLEMGIEAFRDAS